MSVDLGELYAASRYRITDLIMTSPHDVGDRPCPATPEWSVHDLVAHVRGVTEDVRAGNVAEAGSDPWTAAQVERHRGRDVRALLDDWSDDAAVLEGLLSSPHGGGVARAVIDVYSHEADVRNALGRSAELSDPFGEWMLSAFGNDLSAAATSSGLPAVRIVTHEGDSVGPADATVVLTLSRFELFRSRLGRRSPAQVLAYDWGGVDGTPYLEHFFVFGPRADDLTE